MDEFERIMNNLDQNMSLDYLQMGVPEECRHITHIDEDDSGDIITTILKKFGIM